MAAWYRQGTIALTNASTAITGTLTGWTNQVKAGDALLAPDGKWYEIAADAASNTALTLVTAYAGSTASGQSYAINRCSTAWGAPSSVPTQIAALLQMLPIPAAGEAGYGARVKAGGGGYEVYVLPPSAPALNAANAYQFVRQNSAGTAYETAALPLLRQGGGLLINGDFQVNQRAFAGGALAAGIYGYDRWRGAGTISTSGFLVTLSSGSIIQVIEPAAFGLASLASTSVTVSMDTPSADVTIALGTATGVITAGSGRRSVTLTTGAGDTGNIAFSITKTTAGTVTFGRVKASLVAFDTAWIERPFAHEVLLCQRYFYALPGSLFIDSYDGAGGAYYYAYLTFPVMMRATPTATGTITSSSNLYASAPGGAWANSPACGNINIRGATVGRMYAFLANVTFSAEL